MIKQQQILQKSKENEMHAAYISVVEEARGIGEAPRTQRLEESTTEARFRCRKESKRSGWVKVEEPEVDHSSRARRNRSKPNSKS